MYILYFTEMRPKPEYAFVLNSVTCTDANKLELVQQTFAPLCFNCVFSHVHYIYAYVLEQLKLLALCKTRDHLDTLFLV
jgi:hypothetical protein